MGASLRTTTARPVVLFRAWSTYEDRKVIKLFAVHTRFLEGFSGEILRHVLTQSMLMKPDAIQIIVSFSEYL